MTLRRNKPGGHRALHLFLVIPLSLFLMLSEAYGFASYDTGFPALSDIWVDPLNGNDAGSGVSRADAVRTLIEAWNRVPQGITLSGNGYRILLSGGDYPEEVLPAWMESRRGTYSFPVILQAADGPRSVRFHGYLNISNVSYLYLIDIDFVTDPGYGGGGNVLHLASSDHILLRGCDINGFDGLQRQPQESLKVNQVQHIYVEDSDISGAFWFPLDFVAVQYGHIINNSVHDSGDDCFVLKGGTSYLTIEGNEIYDCGVTGLTAGQGTGFEYMVSPWIHYEAYDLKFVNNVVHDVLNAGIAVRGGYNILFAYNTLYRVGIGDSGSGMLLAGHGARSCDGDASACLSRNLAGGWGPVSVGEGGEWIPNRNVYIYNNVFYNPAGVQTIYSHFDIFGPASPPGGTNIPSPSYIDTNLQIRGNIIWNGAADLPLGVEDPGQGCQMANPSCNSVQLLSENSINVFEPYMISPSGNDFHLLMNSNNAGSATFVIPSFPGNDRPSPPLAAGGYLDNSVASDKDGAPRVSIRPGAFTLCNSQPVRTQSGPYTSIQAAYEAVADGGTIEIVSAGFAETLTLGRDISAFMAGGYDCGFVTSASSTTIVGSLLIHNGSLEVSNLTIL